jgi:hypothetical protein
MLDDEVNGDFGPSQQLIECAYNVESLFFPDFRGPTEKTVLTLRTGDH